MLNAAAGGCPATSWKASKVIVRINGVSESSISEELMLPLSLSMNRVALDLRVPVTRIADIVNKRRGVTADTALSLARYFSNSASFWINLQSRLDLEVAEDEIAAKVARDVRSLELSPAD